MKIKTISVTYGRKLNLGDYNSAHVEVSVWADLDEDQEHEGPIEVALDLRDMARSHVIHELARIDAKYKPIAEKIENSWYGPPK